MPLKYKLILHDLAAGDDDRCIAIAGTASGAAHLANIAEDAARMLSVAWRHTPDPQHEDPPPDAQPKPKTNH